MSLFSRVFRKSRPKPEPFVVRLSRQRTTELEAQNESIPEVMSASFLNYLCTFATPYSEEGAEGVARFANDSALFEVGCFMLVHICGWLNTKHTAFAKPVGQRFDDELFRVFTQALQIDNLGKLVDQRISMYREFSQSEDNYERVRHHLSQLLFRAYDNHKPEPYDPSGDAILLSGDSFDVMAHILAWMHGLASMLEGFDRDSALWDSLGRSVAEQRKHDAVAALRVEVARKLNETSPWPEIVSRLKALSAEAARKIIKSTITSLNVDEDWSEMLKATHAIVHDFPDEAEACWGLGYAYYRLGLYDEAITAYREAIRLQPDYPEAWRDLGHCYWPQGRCDDAIAAFRQAIKLKPDNSGAWYSLGACCFSQGKYDEAVAACQQAIKLWPDFPQAWFTLGCCYREQGKYDDAVAALRKAITLEPNDSDSWYALGLAYGKQGKRTEALDALDHLRKLDPSKADKLADLLSRK